MSVQISGVNGTTLQDVDPTFGAARVSIRPAETLGWNSVGVFTGATTVVAANGTLFSFRNISASPIVVRRIGVGHVVTTGFTAAQMLQLQLFFARAWTVSDSGGTAIAITGSNGKHRTSLATPTSVDCRVSTTGALTAGTRVLDPNALAVVGYYAAAATAANALPYVNNALLSQATGDHPLVLAQNEGIVIANGIVHGAGGVGTYCFGLEFAEVSSY